MDILNKLDELEAHADLIKTNIALLKKQMLKHGSFKQEGTARSLDLVARAKAKRAKYRIT